MPVVPSSAGAEVELGHAARVLIRLTTVVAGACRELGITPSQVRLLGLIAAEPQRANLLAERTAVSRPAISQLAEGMVSRGWVRRSEVPGDRRGVFFEVTDEGRNELRAVEDRVSALLDGLVARDDRSHLVSALLSTEAAMDELLVAALDES